MKITPSILTQIQEHPQLSITDKTTILNTLKPYIYNEILYVELHAILNKYNIKNIYISDEK